MWLVYRAGLLELLSWMGGEAIHLAITRHLEVTGYGIPIPSHFNSSKSWRVKAEFQFSDRARDI